MRRWPCLAGLLLLASCGRQVEREVETGYRGAARMNPFLAAERFLAGLGHVAESGRSWPSPDRSDAMLVLPAGMLGNEGYVREAKEWVAGGGHLVCLFAHAATAGSDWATVELPREVVSDALGGWLRETGVKIEEREGVAAALGRRVVRLDGQAFEVSRPGRGLFLSESEEGGHAKCFVSREHGKGRVTLLADARPFRNRYLPEADNAVLLARLAGLSRDGTVHFVRGSGISFWGMLWSHGWPGLAGLLAVVIVWLWRSMSRLGPVEEEPAVDSRRDHRRHLEATGGYFWRLDRGQGLLVPMRGEVIERLQRRRAAAGKAGDDIFSLAEAISGLPRERVVQALTDSRVSDPASFTRVTADLQQLLNTL